MPSASQLREETSGAKPPRSERPHEGWFAAHPPTETPFYQEADFACDSMSCESATIPDIELPKRTVATVPSCCMRGGCRDCVSRSREAFPFRLRRIRPPVPSVRLSADAAWLKALHKSTQGVEEFEINPRNSFESMQLCDAALDIAAQPSMLGVDPMDAYQAVRLYYAN